MNCNEIAAPEFKTSQDKTDVQKDRYNLHLNTNTFFDQTIYIFTYGEIKPTLNCYCHFLCYFLKQKKKNDAELLTIRQQHVSEKLIDLKK